MTRSLFSLAILLAAMIPLLAEDKSGAPAGKDKGDPVKLSADEKALIELTNKSRAEAKLRFVATLADLSAASVQTNASTPWILALHAYRLSKFGEEPKLSPLKVNPLLCKVARQHSLNMARQEKMSHELDGKKVKDRVTEAGYDYRKIGENLAMSSGESEAPASPPADIHKMWMESKGHRANILDPKYTEVGVSMALSKKGTYYYTMVFGVPRK